MARKYSRYTEEEKLEVLYCIRDGLHVNDAARALDVPASTIARWNRKYKIYDKREMREFSAEEKIEILKYAELHGISHAAADYHVGTSNIYDWAEVYGIYTKTGRKEAQRTAENRRPINEIFQILSFAAEYGPTKAAVVYNVAESNIRYWNEIYHAYEPRSSAKIGSEKGEKIIMYASAEGVAHAAKKYGVKKSRVQQLLEDAKQHRK